jgi:small subunit ribosomal protein S7
MLAARGAALLAGAAQQASALLRTACAASTSYAASGSFVHETHIHQYQQRAGYAKAAGGGKKKAAAKGASGGGGGAADGAPSSSAAAFEDDEAPLERDVVRLVLAAVDNVTPHLDVRTVRGSTKTVFVPGVMPPNKGRSLALHWLVRAAAARAKGAGRAASYSDCLAVELLLAYQKGGARQKRDDLHKLALQSRANLHLRWW